MSNTWLILTITFLMMLMYINALFMSDREAKPKKQRREGEAGRRQGKASCFYYFGTYYVTL